MGYVILLHFAQPVNPDYPARHYLEYAENIRSRLADHVAGDRTRTSGIMYACYERNISFVVARIWQDATRRDEYRLRQLGKNPKLCPICNPALKLYTPYQANDPNTWLTMRLQPDVLTARYGDLDTLKPYKYKPKQRTRRNGEHNRTSGNASTWRKDVKQQLAPLALPGMQEFIDALPDDAPAVLDHIHSFRKVIAPQDVDHAPTGFDADLPY